MSKNWFHKLLPAHFVLHSQLYPRVNIICWVRHRRYLRLRCVHSHRVSNNRLGPRQSHAHFLQQCAKHKRGRAQLRQKTQSAEPYLALHRGHRELCTNLGIGSSAAFTTVSFHSVADPTHLHTFKTLPRLTVVKEACLQERGSHTLGFHDDDGMFARPPRPSVLEHGDDESAQ